MTVRCPLCSGNDDKVVDSRTADDGGAIRRRRECLACGHRYTTFERIEEQAFVVVKRSGDRMAFDRARIEAGLAAAAKGRPVSDSQMAALAREIEEEVRLEGAEVTTERIGRVVLDRLRVLDEVAYMRFASVYKGFDGAEDFARELETLTKATEPKRH
jgi:transcriptional repressor NrdR